MRESRDRVTTALTNSGFKMPLGRITINLAPADIRKEGPSFDLAIGVGMLAASEQIESTQLERIMVVGELALTGVVRRVKGVLPIALKAREIGMDGIMVPSDNAAEAVVVEGLKVYPVANLREAAAFLGAARRSSQSRSISPSCSPCRISMARTSPTSRDRSRSSARLRSLLPVAITC